MKRDTALHEATGYIVTRDGHILTKNTGKYKKTYYTKGGYERVRVGTNKNKLVSHLVFEAFSGWEVNTKFYEVHHIDKNPKNNRYDNLIMLDKPTHKLIHMLSEKEQVKLIAEMLDYNFYKDDE